MARENPVTSEKTEITLRQRLSEAWRLARFGFDTLVVPWPPFAVFLALTAAVGGIIPLVRIKVTAGLLNALTARLGAHAAHPPGSLLTTLHPYLPWLAALILVMIVNWIIYMDSYQRYLSAIVTERIRERFERKFYRKALSLRLEKLESAATYDAMERSRQAVPFMSVSANAGVAYRLTNLQRVLTTTIGMIAILGALAAVHWAISLALLTGSVLLLRWWVRKGREQIRIEYTQTPLQRRRDYWRRLLTTRGPAAEVRLFGLASYILDAWRALSTRTLDEVSHARQRNLLRLVPISLATVGLHGLLVALLLTAVVHHSLSIGAFVAYLYALQEYLSHLQNNSSRIEVLQRFIADLRYAQVFLEMDVEEPRAGMPVPEPIGEIRFENVSFAYPGADRPALQGIDLTLAPGERIALVGENGAGKTTLAKLLSGLYHPTEGRITVNGTDLQTLDLQAWRAKVGAVFQDYMRYSLTARQNIGFGALEKLYNLAAVAAAARSSSASTVVETLPKGYETVLGKEFEEGHDLSGGQWQKLALARGYLRDAQIVVLDEPASALDALAEREIYRQFVDLSEQKTMLLITHRLGSVRLADRILFLQRGQLVEEGKHEELIAAGGLYAQLYEMQAQWYRDPEGGAHEREA